jgi:hypothetical protein
MNERILNQLGFGNRAASSKRRGVKGAQAAKDAKVAALHDHEHTIPPKPPEMSWKDYLLMLLHVGAEVEHALMVEYLYAAYSLGGDHVPAGKESQVKGWQNEILSIAREEMGHLLSVQNLVCLLGGAVSFERQDFPWDTPFYPFPFRLEALTLDSLACYVFAEMPPEDALDIKSWANKASGQEFTDEDAAQIQESVFKLAGRRNPHHVSEIYNEIINIVSDPSRILDSDFRAESYASQMSWDDWGRGYNAPPDLPGDQKRHVVAGSQRHGHLIIERVATRTEAIAALKAVAGQGEAPHLRDKENEEPSHFARFLGVYQGFEQVIKHEKWNPVRNVPCNPSTFPGGSGRRIRTYISSEGTRLWAELFNLRYRILLNCLTHSYRLSRTPVSGQSVRGPVMHRAFGEMYNIKTIAGLLMRMPLDDEGGGMRAGPPFQMPYTLQLPQPEADCWRVHLDLLKSASHLCKDLLDEKKGYLKDIPQTADYLRILSDLDLQAAAWVERILKA